LTYIKSATDIPDFKSDEEVAKWYETHSTALIQGQLATVPAKVGGKLASRVAARRGELASERETDQSSRSSAIARRLRAAPRRARKGKAKPETVDKLRRKVEV
jgi:hypothetical protein